MENYYIYEWIRLDKNEPFYIGKGKLDRCFDMKRNKHFKDVVSYCEDRGIDIAVAIIETGLSEEKAYEIECFYIHEYVFEWGFTLTNKTWGGEGGDIVSMMSPEQKKEYSAKMSISLTGKNIGPRSNEVKRKISETKQKLGAAKGSKNPMYGKNIRDYMTEEEYSNWRRNISNALLGKRHSEETKHKMRMAAEGRVVSEATKNKLSKLNCGENNPMYARKHLEQSKALIGKSHEKRVEVLLKDGSKLFFESRNKCAEYFKEEYDIGIFTVKKLIRTGEKLQSGYKKFNEVNGLSIKYI